MNDLKGRSIKGITDVTREEIELILEVSRELKLQLKMGNNLRLLEGKSLAGIFETPSTRTSISFVSSKYAPKTFSKHGWLSRKYFTYACRFFYKRGLCLSHKKNKRAKAPITRTSTFSS